jgi:putative SOS response-associated peptidase YedK
MGSGKQASSTRPTCTSTRTTSTARKRHEAGGPQLAGGEITADLFGFLTTDANAEVGAVHPKAMTVILTEPGELETWLGSP